MTHLFNVILNMSITASYVAVAVIIIRTLLKKAPKVFSYVLWSAVLIRLTCPFTFNSTFSFLGFLRPKIQVDTGVINYVSLDASMVQNPTIDNIANDAINTSLAPAMQTTSTNFMEVIMGIASIIWVIGIAMLIIYSIISYMKVIDNVRTSVLVKDNVFETDRINTPFVCGFIKPKIFIPTGLKENELSYILAHEQTHIKRLDYIVKPFAFLVLVVHWFNPIIWASFALMSKDMEMSCDESVLKQMGNNIKSSYSNSLLSLSVKRSALLIGSPLAFGESNIKSRIKNVLSYKKPALWVSMVAIVITVFLILVLTANPKTEQIPSVISDTYDVEFLIANKTPYVGNNSKVVALIDAMQLPVGIARDTVELQTAKTPYGITINYVMKDASGITEQGAISGSAFYKNAILLFSLIDNVKVITCKIIDNTGSYDGASYSFSYTRQMVDKMVEKDVRIYAVDIDTLKNLIDNLDDILIGITMQDLDNSEIEKYIEIIMSSPSTSSNPHDYIKAHQNEYESILKMGEKALDYLLVQFEKSSNNNDLRGHIMMSLCKELLGDRSNVGDEWLLPQEWFSKLSPYL